MSGKKLKRFNKYIVCRLLLVHLIVKEVVLKVGEGHHRKIN
jgi:hypothetical protein